MILKITQTFFCEVTITQKNLEKEIKRNKKYSLKRAIVLLTLLS